jgi:ribosome-binding factor A
MKNRLDRVNELMKRELDTLIRREVKMPAALVTVQEVDVAPDLKHATVWIGIIAPKEQQYASMARLHDARKQLQGQLAKRVILKFTPQLHFKLDEGTGERGDRVLNIISELNLPPDPASDADEAQ